MTKPNLFQKINEIQKKIKSVHKGSTVKINEKSSYTAVSHDDVTSLLHDPMAEIGILAFPRMETCELEVFEQTKNYQGQTTVSRNYLVKVWASVTFFNSDDRADQFQTQCFAYAIDSGDKATGKAYSMAIKYCYLKTFMLESLDDEESRDWENSYKYDQPRSYNENKSTQPVQSGANNYKPFPASEAQKGALKKMGIEFKPDISKDEASKLIAQGKK